MKKFQLLSLVLMMSVFVGGCSLIPGSTDQEETQHDAGAMDKMDGDAMEKTDDGSAMIKDEDSEAMEKEATKITIDSFKFGYSEDTISVKPGETVELTLTNSDGLHDFVIDELDVATKKISKGETDVVTFTISEDVDAESFAYYCSVGNHRSLGMEGKLMIVQDEG
jgi:plastocyanin